MKEVDLMAAFVDQVKASRDLELQVAALRQEIYDLQRKLSGEAQRVYASMAEAAVNCGPHSTCALASRCLEREEAT